MDESCGDTESPECTDTEAQSVAQQPQHNDGSPMETDHCTGRRMGAMFSSGSRCSGLHAHNRA